TPQGMLDGTFGDGGTVTVDGGSMVEAVRALVLNPDGTIVAAGFVNGEHRGDLLLARFTPSGGLDSTFGTDGMTITDLGSGSERLEGVALQPDGWIVAAGQVAVDRHADFAVVRYDPDGRLDPSFGRGGLASSDFGSREDRTHGLALQPDGGIVAVGQSETNFAVARFDGEIGHR
ncbi:MAG TPA: delta-60 repeat domain-containing protein, partial [Acidimicrobiia bacterium]|nr:delta-60 repeat domain-containing protein [Acidimicrobiia bacterium]